MKSNLLQRFSQKLLGASVYFYVFALAGLGPIEVFAQPGVTNSAFSQTCARGKGIGGLLDYFSCFIQRYIIRFVFVLMVLGFTWGVAKRYILASSDEQRKEGRQYIMWSIIAFFVALSFVSIVALFVDGFGLFTGGSIKPVQFQ